MPFGDVDVLSDMKALNTTSTDPPLRLGLVEPDAPNIKSVACTFSAYHGLKLRVRHLFGSGGSLDPHEPIPEIQQSFFWELFAKIYRIEAQELGYPARGFTSNDYRDFIRSLPQATPGLSNRSGS